MKKQMSLFLACIITLSTVSAQTPGDEFRNSDSTEPEGDLAFYTNQILAQGVAITGTSIIKDCKSGPAVRSLIPFMAGGVAYIASEMVGAKEHSDSLIQSTDKLKMLQEKMKNEGIQKEALEEAINSEKANLKYLQKKVNWMTAISVVYAGAAGVAIWEKATHESLKRAAQVTESTQIGICVAKAATCAGGTLGLGAAACKTEEEICRKRAKIAYEKTIADLEAANRVVCNSKAEKSDSKKLVSTMIAGAYSSFANKAGGKGAISNTVGVATSLLPFLSLLNIQVEIYDKIGNSLLGDEKKRIVTFGSFAAISSGLTVGLNAKKNQIEQNIANLEKVMATYETKKDGGLEETGGAQSGASGGETSGSTSGAAAGISNPGSAGSAGAAKIAGLAQGIKPKSCWSSGVDDFSEKSCSNPLRINTGLSSGMKFPDLELNSVVSKTTEMGDLASRGEADAADIEATNLGSMAAKMKTSNDKNLAKLNHDLKAIGEPAIALESDISKQVRELQDELSKTAAAQGHNLSSIASSLPASSSQASESKVETPTETPTAPVVATVNSDASELPAEEFPTEEFTAEDLETEPSAYAMNVLKELTDETAGQDEIASDTETSLFKKISNRYFLSYDRLFKKKKKKVD